MQSEEENNFWV